SQSGAGYQAVGTWTLGADAGENELTLTTEGLAPARIRATGVPGPASGLFPVSSTSLSATVGTPVDSPIVARLTDAFGNPVANANVTVTVSAGAASASSVTADADGTVAVDSWTLGTTAG